MTVGVVPTSGGGPALIDQTWALGLAQGRNVTYQSGITAHAGGGQTAATQLQPGAMMYSVDTVASGNDSVKLFAARPGHMITIANNSGNTLYIYAYDGIGGAGTAASDTINNVANGTQYSLTTYQAAQFMCAHAGQWAAIKTA